MSEKPKKKTVADYPELVAQWHPTKNGDLRPEDFTRGSDKKVWWQCSEGPDHNWRAVVKSRTRGVGCPCCSRRLVSITNSLASLYPDVSNQWHPTKNGQLTPQQVVAGSHKKYWWKCPKGPDHEWSATTKDRTFGNRGCPQCRGLQPSVTNRLDILFPDVAKLWHPTKNSQLTPQQVVAGSNKKYWWKCPKGPDHEWVQQSAVVTYGGGGCPCCSGYQASITNSLANLYPQLADEWHPTKNGQLTPQQVVAGSHKKYWWKCPKGPDHEWQGIVRNRAAHSHGCPFCRCLKVSVTNSLHSLFPAMAEEWHPTKNGSLTPHDVVAGSNTPYWWQCKVAVDHEWPVSPNQRTYFNTKCPFCNIAPRSKQEIRLAFELAHHIPIDHEFHKIKTAKRLWDVDICSPDLKIVIEFDGSYFHAEKAEKDRAKAKNLRRNGWRVVRVREAPLKKLSKWNVVIPTNADAHEAALLVLEHLQSVLDMDIPRMDERQAAEGPLCAKEAEAYIEKLLLEKQAKEEQDG